MNYRYYAQASVKRTFKGLTVIAEAFNEIEPADTMDGDDPAVFTSYSFEYQDQDGSAIAEYSSAGSLNRISSSIKIDWCAIPGGRRGPLIIETASHGITAALMPMAV